MFNPELIPILLKNCRDRNYAQATEIMIQELGDEWMKLKTYENIRSTPTAYGYATMYLVSSANFKEFSSSAEIPIMIKLAKLDLYKGTTIPELIFTCCRFFPTKNALQQLIQLGMNQSEEKMVKSVFDFKDYQDSNCLTGLFCLATKYSSPFEQFPSGPMLQNIEESFFLSDRIGKV